MNKRDFNGYVSVYKAFLNEGDVQIAYAGLVKYVQKLRTEFSRGFGNEYSIGNVFQGYMDYTYFYLSNDYLKSRKLKFGLVFNHAEASFEVWLLGQTKEVQKKYWELLKNSQWAKVPDMPQYSVFEVTLLDRPDFSSLDELTIDLKEKYLAVSKDILVSLEKVART